MSRDSWKNNRIIIVTVVFPNIWQLWVVSVIVMAGRERCGVFFLLNKGRGPRNVSQSFRNALLLRNQVFLDDSRSSLMSKFMSFYPANNWEKNLKYTKKTNWKFPFQWFPVRSPRRILWSSQTVFEHSAYRKQLWSKPDDYTGNVFFPRGHSHLGLGFLPKFFADVWKKKCHISGMRSVHTPTHSDSTCRLKLPLTSAARCMPITHKKEISAAWAMQCIVLYPDPDKNLLWKTVTDTWNVSKASSSGWGFSEELACVWECVPGS